MSKIFRVRDKVTGKFWNGNHRRSAFGDKGAAFKDKAKAEQKMTFFINYRARWKSTVSHSLPESWEIVEYELIEQEKSATDTLDFLKFVALRSEVEKVNSSFGYFVDTMNKKGVLDKIEFLIKLKPTEGHYGVDMARIKEARAHMRQLGVKTRTFREANGVFGMMDRQQALRARLVLDVEDVIDLAAIRQKLNQ